MSYCRTLPDLQRLVIRSGDEKPWIGTPGDVTYAEFVSSDSLLELSVVSAPQFDDLIGRTGGQPLAVGRKFYRWNRFRMSGQCVGQLIVGPNPIRWWLGMGGRGRWYGRAMARTRAVRVHLFKWFKWQSICYCLQKPNKTWLLFCFQFYTLFIILTLNRLFQTFFIQLTHS